MLYIFGGLPASGKSVLSGFLAKSLGATLLRIDSIEQGLKAHAGMEYVGVEAYVAAYAMAADNLRLGNIVVAESVNPIEATRAAWREVAQTAGTHYCEIEIICSNLADHQARYESRVTDIPGLKFPPWQNVLDREYEPWTDVDITLDTSTTSIQSSETLLLERLKAMALPA